MINVDEEKIYHTQVCEQILHLHLCFLQEGVHPFGEGLLLDVEPLLLQGSYTATLKILELCIYLITEITSHDIYLDILPCSSLRPSHFGLDC